MNVTDEWIQNRIKNRPTSCYFGKLMSPLIVFDQRRFAIIQQVEPSQAILA